MILAHVIPMLLFLILPKFGISSQWTVALFVLTMVIAHVWMIKGHSEHKEVKNGLLSKSISRK